MKLYKQGEIHQHKRMTEKYWEERGKYIFLKIKNKKAKTNEWTNNCHRDVDNQPLLIVNQPLPIVHRPSIFPMEYLHFKNLHMQCWQMHHCCWLPSGCGVFSWWNFTTMQVILSALPRVNAVSVSFLAAASGFSSLCEIETASYSRCIYQKNLQKEKKYQGTKNH